MTSDRTEPTPPLCQGTVALQGEREVVAEREFGAPRARVYALLTGPRRVPEWWGAARLRTGVERMEVRPVGRWRILRHDVDGTVYAFHGEYREVDPPRRIARTVVFEGAPDAELLETTALEEIEGRTGMSVHVRFPDRGSRDGMVRSGMGSGMREGWERFDRLLGESRR